MPMISPRVLGERERRPCPQEHRLPGRRQACRGYGYG